MRITSSGKSHDKIALQGKHHQDREEEGNQCERADPGNEACPVPRLPFYPNEDEPGNHAGDEGNAKIDPDTFCNLPNAHIYNAALKAKPLGKHCNEAQAYRL